MLNILVLLVLSLVSISPVFASVSIVKGPTKLAILTDDAPSQVLHVRNPDKKNVAYVELEVYELDVSNGGQEASKVEGKMRGNSLAVLPNKLVIPPNGLGSFRLFFTGNKAPVKDRYFKIRYVPIDGRSAEGAGEDGTDAILFFSIATASYAAVIRDDPIYAFDISKKDSGVFIENSGNSVFTVNDCNVCAGSGRCSVLSQIRVLPGVNRAKPIVSSEKYKGIDGEVTWSCKVKLGDDIEHISGAY